jgi:hypothetical protein
MKSLKRIIILPILCMAAMISHAQNLVSNNSFEVYTTCPTGGSQISFAFPWQGATTNSTDYYNSCSASYNVPFCGGFQFARSGNAYAGLWTINPYGYNYREYLRISLDSTLQSDSCYLVEFYCSLNNLCRYGINKLGVYISSAISNTVGPGTVLQNTPQIVSSGFLNDTLNWMRVYGYYQASGGEQYITIGNFNTDSLTDTISSGGYYPGAYYLIDDVKVEKITGCDSTGTGVSEKDKTTLFKIYPNPGNGTSTFEYHIEKNTSSILEIRDITGKLIENYSLDPTEEKLSFNLDLESGIYFYTLIVDGQLVKSDKLIIIK